MSTTFVPCDVAPHAGLGLGRESLRMVLRTSGPAWIARSVCRAFRAGRAAEPGRARDAVTSLERALVALRGGLERSAAFNAAMSAGRLDVLQLLTRGWGEWIDCRIRDDTWSAAAERGHLETLQWVAAFGYRVGSAAWLGAVKAARMDVLEWLHAVGCEVADRAVFLAIKHGHMCVVQRMHAWGYRLPLWSMDAAAFSGQVDMLDWLDRVGGDLRVPFHGPCFAAASRGNLAALRWLRDRHCRYPWAENVTAAAARNGHLVVWLYARAHGCPSSADAFQAALDY